MIQELSIEGAKESRSVIKQFHSCLNHTTLVPDQTYRRNSGVYPLACYVNHILGLFLSKNYQVIPIFVARAAEHMSSFPPSPILEQYYAVVTSYLSQIVYHLQTFIEGSIEFDNDRIPPAILSAGPQRAPTIVFECGTAHTPHPTF